MFPTIEGGSLNFDSRSPSDAVFYQEGEQQVATIDGTRNDASFFLVVFVFRAGVGEGVCKDGYKGRYHS